MPAVTMPAVVYKTGGSELFDEVGPLWERLRAHHAEHSQHFSQVYLGRSFEDRLGDWLNAQKTEHRTDLVLDAQSGRAVGFCVSTVDVSRVGEIESLYIESEYRGQGIGEELMTRAIAWLDEMQVCAKHIAVAGGNEQAIGFYNRFGFFTKRLVLEQINDK